MLHVSYSWRSWRGEVKGGHPQRREMRPAGRGIREEGRGGTEQPAGGGLAGGSGACGQRAARALAGLAGVIDEGVCGGVVWRMVAWCVL